MKYGMLEIIDGEEGKTRELHKCRCDCGNVTWVKLASLRSGNTRSCGCLRKKMVSKRFKKHGMRFIPEYSSWQLMKDRCLNINNKTYSYYGGKGVKICDRWLDSFQNFIDDMGKKPESSYSIERIDGDGDYTPENCKWASKKEQVRNRKNTKLIEYKGEVKPLAEWCEILDLDYANTNKRIWRGWSVERAFEEKKR